MFVHILRSTLRQIDVRALLLHFLSPGLKYEEEETANEDGSVGVCWFSFSPKSSEKFLLSVVCLVALEGLGGKGSLFHDSLLINTV